MELFAALTTWTSGPFSLNFPSTSFLPRNLAPSILTDLKPLLSHNASISLPSSPLFANATLRWQEWADPNITVVVEVATEQDVQETVKYANRHNRPFLAVSGGHGAISSLGKLENGIQISMRQLNGLTISADGKTANIGGGILTIEMIDALWSQGKQAATGLCECTGAVGPLLGGGHGMLQGEYGLLADNIISARVVTADGEIITVSKNQDEHPDLFWALRGAGHNFGFVVSFDYKIHELPPNDSWAYESYVFSGDKVKEVYGTLNTLRKNGSMPEIIDFSNWAWNEQTDASGPVISLQMVYHGSLDFLTSRTESLRSISALSFQSGITTYPHIPSLTGNGYDGLACGHGSHSLRFPLGLERYDTEAMETTYDEFKRITTDNEVFHGSFFLFEGYGTHAIKAVDERSTAFPHRADNLLITPVIIFLSPSSSNATTELDAAATIAGKRLREILQEACDMKELHAYVNYAHGDETLQEIYGFEKWRVKKLKTLKAFWDPKHVFKWYAPVV